ncbi:hypothetical protein [Chryseobacterium sp. W4I1]|uniref:hypothetical protein n=1 Tax=Chryseobacterium sp. W4I1 TaxID=3042293 RepID=UPI0027809525|nr:hypothetical protein [Chryseobacterium sp. W4I1]MDQ0783203.1 hypothetical protein [Chryseobacterium sp. W4I1]
MLQWGVQSIAALGLLEKYNFYPITLGWYGQEVQALAGLPPLQPVKNDTTENMKKTRTDIQCPFSVVGKKYSAVQMMEAFFQLNDLAASKKKLNSIMNYAVKRNSRIKEDPSVIFHFRQSMQSFVRAGYLITLKEKKWAVNIQLEEVSPLVLGLLSEKEYQNPLLVFKKAFREYSIKEFDYFMSGMVYFSLGVHDNLPERNIVSPYIHLTKMLDAAHLILERRGKNKLGENYV